MNFPDALFPQAWAIGAFVPLFATWLWCLRGAPWRDLADSGRLNVWLGTTVLLILVWSMKAGVKPGLDMHLLGATMFTLMFGPRLAILGLSLVLAGVTLNNGLLGREGWEAYALNALALADAMRRAGVVARVQSALTINQVAEPYVRGKALRYLEEGKIVIFGAGTGNPFFTTDTAAALRGREINADLVLKATKVDGVYTADPMKDPSATRYTKLTFDEAIVNNLKVMDATALALCRDQQLRLNVFSIFKAGALKRVVCGEDEGTTVVC